MNGNWRTVIAVCMVVAVVHFSGSSADDQSCSEKIDKCWTILGIQYTISAALDAPADAIDLLCRDNILKDEARALICIMDALETRECLRSLEFGPLADGLDELPAFEEDRLEEALAYICDHTDALARVTQCLQWHNADGVEERCKQSLIEDLSGDGASQVCDGLQLFLQSCMTVDVWPKCYAADLDVMANVIDKLVPTEDCVEVSGAGQVAGNVALVITTIGLVYTGLL